jgi:hypothetical protein
MINGNVAPAANLNFAGCITVLYLAVLATIDANHWFNVPESLYGAAAAVNYLAAHLWDVYTGDNKTPPSQ